MKNRMIRKKKLLALLLTLSLLPALPALAAENGFSLEWQGNGPGQAALQLTGLAEHAYAVQLDLTLDGTCQDVTFTPDDPDAYTPECRVEAQGGKTAVTVYLVGREPLNDGTRLSLGTLKTASGVLPSLPDEARLTLLNRDLKPISGADESPVRLGSGQSGEGGGNSGSGESGSSGGSSSSGGSESRGSRVKLEQPEHGTIRTSPAWAEEGETVTVTVRPDTGYVLDKLEVTGSGGRLLKLEELGDNRFRFTMPGSQVKVSAALIQSGEAAPELPFTDVTPGDWFYEAAAYVYAHGMMLGTTETAFSPQVTTNRGMIVTILYRLEGSPAVPVTGRFRDVPPDMYCAAAVEWAAANGVAGGYGNGTFGPRDTITRQQLATILYRYAAFKGYSTEIRENPAGYPDGASVAPYAWDAMGWAAGNVLLLEDSAGMLQPQAGATRAQAAFALTGLCLDIAKLS